MTFYVYSYCSSTKNFTCTQHLQVQSQYRHVKRRLSVVDNGRDACVKRCSALLTIQSAISSGFVERMTLSSDCSEHVLDSVVGYLIL